MVNVLHVRLQIALAIHLHGAQLALELFAPMDGALVPVQCRGSIRLVAALVTLELDPLVLVQLVQVEVVEGGALVAALIAHKLHALLVHGCAVAIELVLGGGGVAALVAEMTVGVAAVDASDVMSQGARGSEGFVTMRAGVPHL